MKISKFTGIRNVGLHEKAPDGDLYDALNVFFHDDGSIETRPGYDLVVPAVGASDLYPCGDGALFTLNGTVNLLRNDMSLEVLGNLVSSDRMAYVSVAGRVYGSNGYDAFVYKNGVVSPWGVQPPPAVRAFNAAGDLTPGQFSVCLTYIMDDGSESGASIPSHVVAEDGGILLIDIVRSSSPHVDGICVYMTNSGGEIQNGAGLFRVAELTNDNAMTFRLGGGHVNGVRCSTFNMAPPPPGQCLGFHKGRIYIGSGDTLWYTEPWMYGLVSLDWGHVPLKNRITMIQPLDNGIWVGTEKEFMFLAGDDPMADGGLKVRVKSPVGVAYGSATVSSSDLLLRGMSPGQTAVWVGSDGVYAGDGNGIFTNMTAGKWEPESIDGRCGVIDYTQGSQQYTFVLNV